MTSSSRRATLFKASFISLLALPLPTFADDPCAAIAGKKWVSPAKVRACMSSFPVDRETKANVIEVVNKTIAFHTSVSNQIQAPAPFEDTHEDLYADLARIKRQHYKSEFEMHIDMSRTFKRLNDGHCVYIDYCYDSLYVSYLPIPLVLLTNEDGDQSVHVAPEAYTIAQAEFGDHLHFWEDEVKSQLRGASLKSLSGAQILQINGQDPWVAVNANAAVTGGYQGFGTRQNSFFSSYSRGAKGWNYLMGNFAQQSLPLYDHTRLTILRINSTSPESLTMSYQARFGSMSKEFEDGKTYRERNCRAVEGTNGRSIHDPELGFSSSSTSSESDPFIKALQLPPHTLPSRRPHKHRREFMNAIIDSTPFTNIELPEVLQPSFPAGDAGYGVSQTYMLPGNTTGVLVLGSFSAKSSRELRRSLVEGVKGLKRDGAERLIVDVTNNGGGYICVAHWLHRILVGPTPSSTPQAGLDTTTLASPLAQHIVHNIITNSSVDPDTQLLYNPVHWRNASHMSFGEKENWLEPLRGDGGPVSVNGRTDVWGRRVGQECQPFDDDDDDDDDDDEGDDGKKEKVDLPMEVMFEGKDVAIVSNGRCASSCSLFSITMAKKEGATTVVVGGKNDVQQQYCGIVGGQSTHFATIDEEIKSTNLKNHPDAPPDFTTNSVQGITWRLGYGVWDERKFEEWQDHPADLNLPLTAELVNNPKAIWEEVDRRVFGGGVQSRLDREGMGEQGQVVFGV